MDFHKFSLVEALNNSKGKTSLGLVMCLLFGLAGFICTLLVPVFIFLGIEVAGLTALIISVITFVFGYLGARRFSNDKDLKQENI